MIKQLLESVLANVNQNNISFLFCHHPRAVLRVAKSVRLCIPVFWREVSSLAETGNQGNKDGVESSAHFMPIQFVANSRWMGSIVIWSGGKHLDS